MGARLVRWCQALWRWVLGDRLVHYPEADVLFTTPAEVDRLCKTYALNARPRARYRGCYFPAQRLAIVSHGDAATLAHELRHAREGAFHS